MARKSIYELNYSFEAPDIKKTEMLGKAITEYFEEGDILIGEYYKKNYILVDDRFVFPIEYVSQTDKMPYLKKDSSFDDTIDRIKAQSVLLSDKENERLNEAGVNIRKTIEGKKAQEIKDESKSYKNGALLGLAGGILSALYFKKNIWFLAIIGLAVGGYVSHKIYISKKGNNEVNPT